MIPFPSIDRDTILFQDTLRPEGSSTVTSPKERRFYLEGYLCTLTDWLMIRNPVRLVFFSASSAMPLIWT